MKLNRYISILLTGLLLMSNLGLALNVHYCHGKVSSVTFAYKADEPCNDHHEQQKKSCCAAAGESHKKCCENDLVKLQDNSDNIIVKSLQLDLSTFYVAEQWHSSQLYYSLPVAKQESPSFYCEANAPPLFKLYCQYILYA